MKAYFDKDHRGVDGCISPNVCPTNGFWSVAENRCKCPDHTIWKPELFACQTLEAPVEPPTVVASCPRLYEVLQGDNCFKIATKLGTTVAKIFSLNPSINSGCTNLAIGQVLCIGVSNILAFF
jgi:LysM repeat protein